MKKKTEKKKKIKVKFGKLKSGECFQHITNGPIYMKDNSYGCSIQLNGRNVGRAVATFADKLVYPTKVKIVEEK